MPYLSCREASAAMALVTAASEPNHMFTAFTSGKYSVRGWRAGLRKLAISPRQRLDDVVDATSRLPFGGTDCALPMVESPLEELVFLEAAELYRSARRAGITPRSGVDCLIATCGIRNNLAVLHRDRDFDLLATVSPLGARQVEALQT